MPSENTTSPATLAAATSQAARALSTKWRIYLIEAALLGLFMVSACSFAALLYHPSSTVSRAIEGDFVRRLLMGAAMGVTAVLLIYSRWGKRSGAHMNPAATLSFLRLGKLSAWDAAFYIAAQFSGGAAGVWLSAFALGSLVSDPPVNYIVTAPGPGGAAVAWLSEFLITLLMMAVILRVNRAPRLAPYTGYFAAALLCLYITFESPLSGTGINPARAFGSAVVARVWTDLWIYFTAPVAGMLAAVELFRRCSPHPHNLCCKLSHCPRVPCIIPCRCAGPPPGLDDASP